MTELLNPCSWCEAAAFIVVAIAVAGVLYAIWRARRDEITRIGK